MVKNTSIDQAINKANNVELAEIFAKSKGWTH